MAIPPQPERQPPVAAPKPPTSPPADTKRPTDSVPMSAGSFAKLPLRFGRYQVEKLLGKGAMGAVYLARDTQLDRLVALKIPILSAKGSEKLLKRLKTEAKAAAQIDHPSVCPVFDSGAIDGIPYIAMQYIEGETLKDHLKNQTKTPQQAVALILQLAEGLAEAHSRTIYHRDLKPENIKLNRRGVPVIMDFGLAKLAATLTADAGATQKGSILGSPAYMSPEQASGKVEEIDHRSDLYALGVMLYEMLTGTWPFSGSAMQVMGQKSVLEPPSPLTVKPELNPQLAAVCQKLIAKKREDRYQTAQEVIAALVLIDFGGAPPAVGTQSPFGSSTDAQITDFLKEIAVGSPRPAAPQKAPAPFSSNDRAGNDGAGQEKLGKDKKKHLLIGGGILGVLVLLAGLVISFRTREGTLVVTVNEPDAEVEVLNEAGQVEIKRKGDKGPITISIDPGKHRLKVQKDGFEFFSKDFELASGGKTSITAKLVRDKPAVAATGWHDWPADAPPPAIAPFDAEDAKKHQTAWAKYFEVPVEYTNSVGMKFVLIPPGEFMMGSTPAEIEEAIKCMRDDDQHWQKCIKSEAPQHRVILTQPIYLGIHEVTQADYEKVMGKNPSSFAPSGALKDHVVGLDHSTLPVEQVSWNDAAEFCAKLSRQEQLRPFYSRDAETVTLLQGTGYRLPTEAEWEFACRAGTTGKYWTGDRDEELERAGWFNVNSSGRTHAVGELKANPFGLCDVHGNNWEWVQDAWEPGSYSQFQQMPALDPDGPSSAGALRVLRGGSWYDLAGGCRASFRFTGDPPGRNNNIGFRVSLPVGAVLKGPATKPVATLNDSAFQKWMKLVAGMPAERQVEGVVRKLQELNPRFDGKVTDLDGKGTPKIENGVVTELAFLTDDVIDISPLRALTGLKTLKCNGSPDRKGKLSGLLPLKGMSLTTLHCGDTQVADLSPLEGMPLADLHCFRTNVATLSPLQGMPLSHLDFGFTKVSDLSPLKENTTLKRLWFDSAPVSELKPLAGLSLTSIICSNSPLSDLAPLKGMPLEELVCPWSKVTDLSPLKGMPLSILDFGFTKVTDLSPLQGMNLIDLRFEGTPVSDLSPLQGMKLTVFAGRGARVSDLSPIKDMPLKGLWFDFKPERDTEILRSIKTLETINGKPAAEFWKAFETSVTFLADLSPVWKTHLPGYFSTDGTVDGRKYLVQGKESPNGILLHPPPEGFSEVVYTLHRAFEKFESGVAIPGTGPGAGSALTFEVIGDDTVLWTSKPVQEFDQPQSCAVNVSKVNTLTLRVHCPGSHSYAQAVWLEPSLSASASGPATGLPPPKWDVERSAAEWVLSLAGTVGLRVERQEREIPDGGALPAGNFVLERIDLRDKPIAGADLARLEGLTCLHKLFLDNCRIGDAGLAHLKDLTGLSELFVMGAGISDAGLAHLKDLTNLRLLGLFANPDVTDAGLSHFVQLTKLENLDLNGTHITNSGLEHLRKLSSLKDLNLMGTAVSDDGIPLIEGLSNLRGLYLAGSRIGDAGLAHLKGLPNLRVLGLDGTLISDGGMEHLEILSKLTVLGIGGTKVSDEGLRHVARVTELQSLHLDRSNVTDAGIDSLLALRKLYYLHVKETRISAAGFARLKEAFPKADLAWSLREDK